MLPVGNRNGIPCGPYYQGDTKYAQWEAEYPDWTGGQAPAFASTILARLAAMKANNQQMILGLQGNSASFKTGGLFDFTKWKANLDANYAKGIESYIEDGTIMGNYMIDEPKAPGSWGGVCVDNQQLDDMAAYSKSRWPTLPCVIRSEPETLITNATAACGPWPGGFVWEHADAAWATYLNRKGNPDTYMAGAYGYAEQQNLNLVTGMNWRDGGDGTSGVQSWPDGDGKSFWWCMSPSEVTTYSIAVLNPIYPRLAAFFMWKLVDADSTGSELECLDYWNSAPMQAAFDDLKDLCASRPKFYLLRRL